MKRRAPISELVNPSAANRAAWSSCGVSCGPVVAADAFARSLPGGRQFAASSLRESLHAHRVEHVVCDAQLRACVGAAALPAQPFPIEQMGTGELGAHARAAQSFDRLAIQTIGLGPDAQ